MSPFFLSLPAAAIQLLLASSALAVAQDTTTTTTTASSTSDRPQFTIPAAADVGANLLANIDNPNATDSQTACPGYKASGVQTTANGVTATLSLAGDACNAYGTDIEELSLKVEYQAADRLNVQITPAYLDASNYTQYILGSQFVRVPTLDADASNTTAAASDLAFSWTNEPSFGFTVKRKSTGDVLFSTEGSTLVFENQYLEFVTSMPSDYNVYGLGESIHGLRLGNNFTKTMWNTDVGDPIDL